MNTKHIQRLLAVIFVVFGLFALGEAALAEGKANHHNGQQLLGEKIKTNGRHVIDKKGDYTTAVEIRDGKVAGVHVNHAKNGEVPVKKYRTNKKMAQANAQIMNASFILAQDYLGSTYIGYAYVDEFGNEQIYWFPYDMVLDPVTGAIDYVPAG